MAGEGRTQSDDLSGFLLLLDSQDSGLPNQSETADGGPAANKDGKSSEVVKRPGDYNSRSAQRALSQSRKD